MSRTEEICAVIKIIFGFLIFGALEFQVNPVAPRNLLDDYLFYCFLLYVSGNYFVLTEVVAFFLRKNKRSEGHEKDSLG